MSASTINVAVIGAGSWGTTVAALAAVNTPTVLWARRTELARQINDAEVNPEYLPNFTLPDALRATDSLADAVSHADVVVMAVPSHGFRDVAVEAAELDPAVGAGRVAVEGARAHHAQADERGDRRRDARPSGGGAHRPEPGQGDPRRPARGQRGGDRRRHDRQRTAADLQPPEPAGVHQRRRRRLRGRRRRQERHRHRCRDGRGHGVRRQHPRHADHPGSGRDDPTRRGDGRPAGDVRRARRAWAT